MAELAAGSDVVGHRADESGKVSRINLSRGNSRSDEEKPRMYRMLELQLDDLCECVDHCRLPLTLRPPCDMVAQVNVYRVEWSTVANLSERERTRVRYGLEALSQDRRAAMYASEPPNLAFSDVELDIGLRLKMGDVA